MDCTRVSEEGKSGKVFFIKSILRCSLYYAKNRCLPLPSVKSSCLFFHAQLSIPILWAWKKSAHCDGSFPEAIIHLRLSMIFWSGLNWLIRPSCIGLNWNLPVLPAIFWCKTPIAVRGNSHQLIMRFRITAATRSCHSVLFIHASAWTIRDISSRSDWDSDGSLSQWPKRLISRGFQDDAILLILGDPSLTRFATCEVILDRSIVSGTNLIVLTRECISIGNVSPLSFHSTDLSYGSYIIRRSLPSGIRWKYAAAACP